MTTKARMTPGDGDPRHGTPNGYVNLLYRCRECTEAHRAYIADARAARPPLAPDDERHGRASTYQNYRCRCPERRDAARIAKQAARAARLNREAGFR